jgi:DNA-binding GntR family transcriptional regulator
MKKLIGLDTADQQPLYIQIRDGLKNAIRERRLLPGEKLPSEQKLSRELGVSVGIVRKALAQLVEEGLICRRQNLGTTVADIAPEDVGRSPSKTIGVVFTNMLDGYFSAASRPM